jgi:hypothetical protein
MNGESERFPPHDERIKPAWNKATGLHELILGGKVIFRFKSDHHFRDFAILCHCMERPLEVTETPKG